MTRRFVPVALAGTLLILGLLPLVTDIPVPWVLGFAAFVLGLVVLSIAVVRLIELQVRARSARRRSGSEPERPEF
jgi:heme A synthase